jgi:hypothetical protein
LNIARLRLHSQHIVSPRRQCPAEVVRWLGALQAQDFAGAKWSIALRLLVATEATIDQAIADRTIIRTWSLRGTLHFAAAADVHWMRALLAPAVIARSATRHRELELDATVFARSEKVFLKALRGGRQLSRETLLALLEKARISTTGQRGYHILWRLTLEGLLCFGAHEGKQATFALLDEWCPGARDWDREAAVAELTHRYFTSHGPATLQDFTGWSGLKISEAKAGLSMCSSALTQETIGDKTYWFSRDMASSLGSDRTAHLLPGFDEYMLGYKDRSPSLDPKYSQKICPGSNGMFIPTVVLDGHVAGTWKRTLKKTSVAIETTPFTIFSKATKRAIAISASRYGQFLGRKSVVVD